MKKIYIILIAVGAVAVIAAGSVLWGVGKYNSLITVGQGVDKSWGQVENVLQRRSDLIPNLVNVVQAYAIQEQKVFIDVAQARSQWAQAASSGTVADKIKASGALSGALFNLMAVAENYPDLKSNQNFLALQDELAGTENRIAVERMRYNESVQTYNTYAKKFPNSMIVGMFKFPAERDYFKADEGAATAPQVRFNYPGVNMPAPSAPAPTVPQAQPQPAAEQGPTTPQSMAAPMITPPAAPTPAPTPAPAAAAPVAAPTAPTVPAPAAPVAAPAAPTPAPTAPTPATATPIAPPTIAPAPAPTAQPAQPVTK